MASLSGASGRRDCMGVIVGVIGGFALLSTWSKPAWNEKVGAK